MRQRSHRVVTALGLAGVLLLVMTSLTSAANATGISFKLPAVTKTTYSISGTVRNAAGTAGVKDIDVYANSTTQSGDCFSGEAVTDASGKYTISDLLPSSYRLYFGSEYESNLQHGYRGKTGPGYFTTSIGAAAVQTITTASLTGKDIRLPNGFKISGKITQTNGTTPLAGIDVSSQSSLPYNDEISTDASGKYTLMGLSPGSYTVNFGHDATVSYQTGCWYTSGSGKFSASCNSHTPVTITTANVSNISPRIPAGLKITGYVKSRATSPAAISGADVYANGPVDGDTSTTSTGQFTIAGLNPGAYKISVQPPLGTRYLSGYYLATSPNYWTGLYDSASNVTISASVTTLNTIKPDTGYFIWGKITTTANAPVKYAPVIIVGASSAEQYLAESTTDSAGNYTVGPVPRGTYKLQVDSHYNPELIQGGWYRNAPPNNLGSTELAGSGIVVSHSVTGINIRLSKGATIKGVVTITGGSSCDFCEVDATRASDGYAVSANTGDDGAYTLQGLGPGSYRVSALASSSFISDTKLQLISGGYYKKGASGNYTATESAATLVTVSP